MYEYVEVIRQIGNMYSFFEISQHFAFSFKIDPTQCQSLRVELKNNAFTSQGSRQGIFTLSSTENGRPSWTKSGSQAQYTYQDSNILAPLSALLSRLTIFPRIVSSLEQFPPLNSFHIMAIFLLIDLMVVEETIQGRKLFTEIRQFSMK